MTDLVRRDDAARLRQVVGASRAPATVRAYRAQLSKFARWCEHRGYEFPVDATVVAAYLAGLDKSPATIGQARAAIRAAYRTAGLADPTDAEAVRRAVAGARRTWAEPSRQARGLTAALVRRIAAHAFNPRGRETAEDARQRGAVDVAVIAVMRDAMLRRSEAADLLWGAVTLWEDGTGRVLVRRSKTDQTGDGAVLWLSRDTMVALAAIRPAGGPAQTRVFGLGEKQIGRRIAAAAAAAGLDGVSGHSPRVGMAQDLSAGGAGLPAIMQAGRWSTSRMAAQYCRDQEAGRNAVAQWYGGEG